MPTRAAPRTLGIVLVLSAAAASMLTHMCSPCVLARCTFLPRRSRSVIPSTAVFALRLRGGGGCGGGGCGSSGCGSGGGGGCGAEAIPESQTPPPEEAACDVGDGGDFALEDGPGDLLEASSSEDAPPAAKVEDLQLAAQQRQELVLAQRREQREQQKQAVSRRAEGSLATSDFDMLCDYFVGTWLEIQLRSCWRPVFEALQSDTIDVEDDEGEVGVLSPLDFEKIVRAGLEIFDEELIELTVMDLKASEGYLPPSDVEVQERVARYMTLDTNGDGVVELQEFAVRFMSVARQAMLDDIDDAFRAKYEADPQALEDEISERLMAMDEQMQADVRPLLKLIDGALFPLRSPGERAAAMIARSDVADLSLFDIIEVARPWRTLEDVAPDGSVRRRSAVEAEVGRMEQQAVRHAIDHDRWEASALFAEALTGVKPPPKAQADFVAWSGAGSVGSDAQDCLSAPSPSVVAGGLGAPTKEVCIQAPRGAAATAGPCPLDGAALPVFEPAGAGNGTEVAPPLYWFQWLQEGDRDDVPRHWHQGPLIYSRGGYRDDVSPVYLAGLLANRAQLLRQACSAASFKLPQFVDDGGHPDTCEQPSPEMADLMDKCLEDLAEAEVQVWRGYDVESRPWLLRHAVNIMESITCQRAMCHYVTNSGDCGARDMALGRDLGHFMSYSMLHKYNPRAIFQQFGAFRPWPEALAPHCVIGGGGVAEPECEVLRVPEEYADMESALSVASTRPSPPGVGAVVVEVSGGRDVLTCAPCCAGNDHDVDSVLHTAGMPIHADLDMADLRPDAPARRFDADRLPSLQPHINHALEHADACVVSPEQAAEIELAHVSRFSEPVLVADEDLYLHGLYAHRRPADLDVPRVPYPDAQRMPREDVRLIVRGPPNARVWGRWMLDKNCRGAFHGLTCALARAPEHAHIEYESFTMLVMAGPWVWSHTDVRAGGPAGAVCMFNGARLAAEWCGLGGMDEGEYRCHEGVVVKDTASCNVSASVMEFCGDGPAGCGTALSVQNSALVRVNSSLMQHNYNHIQILNHPIVRAGNCTFWNHSYALWLMVETAMEGTQLAVERCRFHGPVWRNEWRPAVWVDRDNQRLSRYEEPDTPAASRPRGREGARDSRVRA